MGVLSNPMDSLDMVGQPQAATLVNNTPHNMEAIRATQTLPCLGALLEGLR